METAIKYAAVVFGLYGAAIWVTLIFWTVRDVRSRTRDPILQGVGVALVLLFFIPGLLMYWIVRPRYTLAENLERSLGEEALMRELESIDSCPQCKRRVTDEYIVCPGCRTALKEACRSCSRPVGYSWVACPYCGADRMPRESFQPRVARSAPMPPPAPQRAPVRPAPQQAPPRPQPRSAAPQMNQPAVPPQTIRRAPAPARDPMQGGWQKPDNDDDTKVIG